MLTRIPHHTMLPINTNNTTEANGVKQATGRILFAVNLKIVHAASEQQNGPASVRDTALIFC